jgi:hypothetical protein
MKFKKIIWVVGLLLLAGISGKSESYSFGLDNKSEAVISVYPNPATEGQVVVSADKEISKIQLLNILGEQILEEETDRSTNFRFELGDLKNGIYLIRITFTDNTSSTKKLWVK